MSYKGKNVVLLTILKLKRCEEELDGDWVYYSVTFDCGDQGIKTEARIPGCLPSSCTADEELLNDILSDAILGYYQDCTFEGFNFEEISSAFTPGAIAGTLVFLPYLL